MFQATFHKNGICKIRGHNSMMEFKFPSDAYWETHCTGMSRLPVRGTASQDPPPSCGLPHSLIASLVS